MSAQITILAEGKVDTDVAKAAFESIPDVIEVKQSYEKRSIAGTIVKIASWIANFKGSSDKIADALIKVAETQLAGSNLKIRIGDLEVDIINARRKDIIAVLEKTQQMARAASTL